MTPLLKLMVCFGAIGLGSILVFGWSGCDNRACRNAVVCEGYACIEKDALCLRSCKDNGGCAQLMGYICAAGKCICNADDPTARCHLACTNSDHCKNLRDAKTGKTLLEMSFECSAPKKDGPFHCNSASTQIDPRNICWAGASANKPQAFSACPVQFEGGTSDAGEKPETSTETAMETAIEK